MENYSIIVEAKPEYAEQINQLWNNKFGGFLIYTPKMITYEINVLKNDPQEAHLAAIIHSIDDWNNAFGPGAAAHGGMCIVNSLSDDRIIDWLLEHQLLLKSITGLTNAANALGIDIAERAQAMLNDSVAA